MALYRLCSIYDVVVMFCVVLLVLSCQMLNFSGQAVCVEVVSCVIDYTPSH